MNYYIIKNKYKIEKYDYPDLFKLNIYYLNDNSCQIMVHRLDTIDGWGLNLEIYLYDITNKNKFEKLTIGS